MATALYPLVPSYASAMLCPVLRETMLLRMRCVMSGTDRRLRCYACATRCLVLKQAMLLLPSTDVGYAARLCCYTYAMRCPVLA
eukprot:2600885-Rhodomonas_salina.1